MKKLFIIASALVLFIAGCSTAPIIQTSVLTDTVVNNYISPDNCRKYCQGSKVIDPISGNEYTIKPGETGTANVDARATGYYDGYAAHWNGLVLNGMYTVQEFNITVTPYTNESYGITTSPQMLQIG